MTLIPGYATAQATSEYATGRGDGTGQGHFSDFLQTGIQLSSLGLGTFPGQPTAESDREVAQIICDGLLQGVNVIDTATHYRYGHALAAVHDGIRMAIEQGVPREAMFLISKGGFLSFDDAPPENLDEWVATEIEAKGYGSKETITNGVHLLSPAYLRHQLDHSRQRLGIETLDAFLIDQPEIHIPEVGKEQLNQQLLEVFVVLEQAVQAGELRHYGISTFNGFRVETDNPLFQSLTSMLGLAEKAAAKVWGEGEAHHFSLVQMPYNLAMAEGFTRFNQATGVGNIASTLQAAYQLGVFVMGSHTLMKGQLAQADSAGFPAVLQEMGSAGRMAMQFARSTPGVGCALVGMSKSQHLADLLAVSQHDVVTKQGFITMFEKVG